LNPALATPFLKRDRQRIDRPWIDPPQFAGSRLNWNN